MLKNCYSGKVTHLLHSLPLYLSITPVEALPIRTDFLAFFVISGSCCIEQSHLHLGGIGFTSSKWWTKSTFIGGGKNFVFEFCRRYPSQENLLVSTSSVFLVNLRS
ncbi:hypothetical protein GEMRC1_003773 [Eukaryota sp. GEM-RC1]